MKYDLKKVFIKEEVFVTRLFSLKSNELKKVPSVGQSSEVRGKGRNLFIRRDKVEQILGK